MICTKCNQPTNPGQFATYRTSNGESRRRGICKSCRGQHAIDNFEYLQKWRKEYNAKKATVKSERDKQRRMDIRKIVDDIKINAACMDCGNYFPAVAMDFDHVHGKSKPIANMVAQTYRLELILAEIALCEIVCACCHRVRTKQRKQNHAPHKGEKS